MWSTTIESHFASIVTQSAVVHGSRLYVGVSSLEESLAAFIPGYICCTFRGSMARPRCQHRQDRLEDLPGPRGYSGNAVWGSTPAVDTSRGQVYIATGNNYSVPAAALSCVAGLPPDDPRARDCLADDDYFDSIIALDLKTGAIRWVRQALPFDAWTVDCIPIPGATGPTAPTRRARLRLRPGAGVVHRSPQRQRHAARPGRRRPEERAVLGGRPRYRGGRVGDAGRPGRHRRGAAVGIGSGRNSRLHRERQ